jgi:hypothetical protein
MRLLIGGLPIAWAIFAFVSFAFIFGRYLFEKIAGHMLGSPKAQRIIPRAGVASLIFLVVMAIYLFILRWAMFFLAVYLTGGLDD